MFFSAKSQFDLTIFCSWKLHAKTTSVGPPILIVVSFRNSTALTGTESESPTSGRDVTDSTHRRQGVSGHCRFNSYGAGPKTRRYLKTQACSTQSKQQAVEVPLSDSKQSSRRAQILVWFGCGLTDSMWAKPPCLKNIIQFSLSPYQQGRADVQEQVLPSAK